MAHRPAIALLLLLTVLNLGGMALAQSAPVFSVTGLGKGLVAIDGPWQFHLGDDIAYASPTLDDRTGHNGWEQISTNRTWGEQGHPAYAGYAWYRRHLHLTPAPGTSGEFALLNQHTDDAYEIYWNGVLVARGGRLPPKPRWRFSDEAHTYTLGALTDGVLAVRVWKAPLSSFDSDAIGGFNAPPLIGSPEAIATRKAEMDYQWLRSRQYTFALTSLYALIAVLSLLSWGRDRSQPVLLWMAVFSSAPVGRLLLLGLRFNWPYSFALSFAQPIFSQQDIGLWFLLLYLLQFNSNERLMRLTRVLAVISFSSAVLDGAVNLLDWSNPAVTLPAQIADAVLTGIFTTLEAYPLVLVVLAARRRLDPARWLVAFFAFLSEMISVVAIATQQGVRYTHWSISQWVNQPLFVLYGNSFTMQALASTALLLSIIYAVYRYSRDERRRQTEMEQELRSARELQQVLIPEALPPLEGFALTSAYHPSQEVGGDFFQIIPFDENGHSCALVVLGDVSGKGLKAAMTVSLIVGAVRTVAEFTTMPGEVLAALNRRLYGRLRGGFATCLALRLEPGGRCVLASAGHPAPFLNQREVALPGALPLGVLPDARYSESALQLSVSDHMVLYTDGLLEARTADGELFSFDRLSQLMASRPDAAHATQVARDFGQQDDITVLTLTRLEEGAESTTRLSMPALARTA